MSEHTKGPWMAAAKRSSVVGLPVVSPVLGGRIICEVCTTEADAQLIAAAPDLLEALEGMVDLCASMESADRYGEARPYLQAQAAVAKARGEQT